MVLTAEYGRLLSKALPKRIENDAEMERITEVMEPLSRAIAHGTASAEEKELHSLLSILIREYDDRTVPLEPGDPIRILQFLMEQRGLRAIDLTPIFGARSLSFHGSERQAGIEQDSHPQTRGILSRFAGPFSGGIEGIVPE